MSVDVHQNYKGTDEITMNSYMPIKWKDRRMDKLVETYDLPRLNQKEIQNMNRPLIPQMKLNQ